MIKAKTAAVILLLAALARSSFSFLPVSAATQAGNAISNPNFENQPAICDTGQSGCVWQVYRDAHSTPADATVTSVSTRSVDGTYSARIDMTISNPIGFIGLYQTPLFPQGTLRFSNLTSTANGFDFWFYIQPKYGGTASVVVRVLSMSARELDYAIDPNPGLSYFNNTSGSPPTAAIELDGYPLNQWDHFSRNLRSDWQLFYNLNESLSWVEFDSVEFQDYTGQKYSETTWVDLVQVLYGAATTPQPPTLPPSPGSGPFTLPTFGWIIATAVLTLGLVGIFMSKKRKRIAPPPG